MGEEKTLRLHYCLKPQLNTVEVFCVGSFGIRAFTVRGRCMWRLGILNTFSQKSGPGGETESSPEFNHLKWSVSFALFVYPSWDPALVKGANPRLERNWARFAPIP